ncbi:hypothetical protein NDU88_001640 [Pleurodeles waltl]|uniref:Uncharacterized protein n=1 Tax=Pleurodeles waltl TaxID=8319 RepID=A0AAV7VCD9_PLEWA|nr:hypothetical protein NDU88_001640 [Pleurodeles waltl]
MMSPSLPLLARSAGTAPGLPQSAERELRFPDAGSRTKMYNDAGGILSLAKIPPDSLAAGGSKVQNPASENHRSSPEHRPGEICSRPKSRDAWRLSSVRREFTGSALADRHVPPFPQSPHIPAISL